MIKVPVTCYYLSREYPSAFSRLPEKRGTVAPYASLLRKIATICAEFKDSANIYFPPTTPSNPLEENGIILLIAPMKELISGDFLDKLIGAPEFRPVVPPEDRHDRQNLNYDPIITIGFEDFLTLFAEEPEEEKKWNEPLSRLNLDPRIKFLDSSIWHRYVPIRPQYGDFSSRFRNVLGDILIYLKEGLYNTLAARSTLEFHLRMVRESYIAKIGNSGHSELVTPFKFHSETHMSRKAKEEEAFFHEPWSGTPLIRHFRWNALIIDDYADEKISSVPGSPGCQVNKRDLIHRPIDQLYGTPIGESAYHFQTTLPDRQIDIPQDCTDKMTRQTFDILFLDYLLGRKSEDVKKREYGFDFLLDLLADNRKETPKYRRDFLGKYWIFPVSSFPYALIDKIDQLGISHLHEIWHLARGADPITTPHLYTHNLYRFLKQKIGKYFLYPNALRRFFNENPVQANGNLNLKDWAEFLDHAIRHHKSQTKLLETLSFDSLSPFVLSMHKFLSDRIDLPKIFRVIKKITAKLKAAPIKQEDKKVILKNLDTLVDINPVYKEILTAFSTKVQILIAYGPGEAQRRITEFLEKGGTRLDLRSLGLNAVPDELSEAKILRTIDLSNNQLTQFPKALLDLPDLQKISLEENKIYSLSISDLERLPPNAILILGKNPLPLVIIKKKKEVTVQEIIAELRQNENKIQNGFALIIGPESDLPQVQHDVQDVHDLLLDPFQGNLYPHRGPKQHFHLPPSGSLEAKKPFKWVRLSGQCLCLSGQSGT